MDNIIKYLSAKGKYLLTAVLLGSTLAMSAAGGREVKGRVVDPEGNPIPGAVVNLAEQSRIVLTDQDGNFVLKDAGYDDEVNAKCIGFLTNIVTIEDLDTPLVITLEPDNVLEQ